MEAATVDPPSSQRGKRHRHHSDAFKRKALQLAERVGNRSAAEQLNIHDSLIGKWKRNGVSHRKSPRAFTDKQKASAVALAEKIGVVPASRRLGIRDAMIYRWRNGASTGLPTTPVNGTRAMVKPRALKKALAFACPHCGNPVLLPE